MSGNSFAETRNTAEKLEQHLKTILNKDQGVRFGESAVISTKVHANDAANPGDIHVLTYLDAGQTYLKTAEAGQFLHIDVFHQTSQIDPVIMGRRIWYNLNRYFDVLKRENPIQLPEEEWVEMKIAFARRLMVATGLGHGDVYDLASNRVLPNNKIIQNHVHILAQIPSGFYDFLIHLVEAAETSIVRQGYEIRKVERLINLDRSSDNRHTPLTLPIPPELFKLISPMFRRYEHIRSVMNLVTALGSIEEAAQFMECLTPTGNIYLGRFRQRHNDLTYTLQELIEAGLVKKGRLLYTLTDEGKELRHFLRNHQRELESEIRKAIIKKPMVSREHSCFYNSRLKARKKRLTDRRRVVHPSHNWYGQIAIPETIIQAAVRSYFSGENYLCVKMGDIRVYGQKSYAPIDTCLLIDCSGSMVGKKVRAVSELAEHLSLSSREKVSIMSFQEMDARIVVPFTKNHKKLQDGLRSIIPEGLTPLAKGIVEAVKVINGSKARNPLLVLITDGLPNYPFWTRDAQADALKAAELISRNKIRCVIIGLKPDERYLRKLSEKAGGNLYIIDQFNLDDMANIVHQEWADYGKTSRIYN